ACSRAWLAERPGGNAKLLRRQTWRGEVEHLRQIVRGLITYREGFETPAPFDHAQDGGMVEDETRDVLAPRERRHHHGRDPEPEQPVLIAHQQVGVRNRRRWRRHVVEEAAPLVIVEHE